MTDPTIKPGDVCHDLVERGKVQVVERVADSVAEHREHNHYDIADYKANATLDVSEDEPVFACTYLPSGVTASFGGDNPYDFPASRLARVPVEAADDRDRIQRALVVETLATLLENAITFGNAEPMERPADFVDTVRLCWPDEHADVFDDALEFAEARVAAEEVA